MHLIRNRFLEIVSILLTAYLLLAAFAATTTIVRCLYIRPEPLFSVITVNAAQPEHVKNSRRLPSLAQDSVYWIPPAQRRHVLIMERSKALMHQRLELERKLLREGLTPASHTDTKQSFQDPMETDADPVADETRTPASGTPHAPASGVEHSMTPADLEQAEYEQVAAEVTEEEWADLEWEPSVSLFNVSLGNTEQKYMVRRFDQIRLTISGTVNLAKLWDWNTKAIYVCFIAKYGHRGAPINEVTFADAVMRAPPPRSARPSLIQDILQHPSNLWTPNELEIFNEHLQTLRTAHDVPSLLVDPYEKHIYLNSAIKYVLEDYHHGYISYTNLEVVMRYQVMSFSGWAPLRENTMGGRLYFHALPYATEEAEKGTTAENVGTRRSDTQ